ncbi:putative ATP-dependent RNA helicase [Polyplosphaeria fusca]|uniref:ATP-dependent RNA helicase n=1 Tax=Polyplosphaeria fusca TaxID=682080 RepID=A0A9P4QVD0_9PLEO|nr:putative ATP-dependent RNA helicase [Polyplosphaeria fusca]
MAGLKKRKLNISVSGLDAARLRYANASAKPTKTSKSVPTPKPPPQSQTPQIDSSEEDENEDGDEEVEDSSVEEPAQNPSQTPEASRKTFADLGVIEQICETCAQMNFTYPTPIQEATIPLGLAGRDVVGLAETGSGKTAAFAIPILQALMDSKSNPKFFGLVLAPTRELAYQISEQFSGLGAVMGVRCAVLVGGMDMVAQAIALSKFPHILIATPGRLLDHLENTKGFSLKSLRYLVMDEADRLLDLDFGPILDKILKVLPREHRRTYLFSATMSSKVEQLQRASLSSPVKVNISSSDHQTVSSLLQRYLFIPYKYKDHYLIHLLNDNIGHPTIIFTRTVNETQRIAILLRTLGFGAIPLHGQLSQSARLGALNKFKTKSRDILVATDVAARGLDIPSVDLVINLDLPGDSKTYVHRVGRTARAGKSGKAVSIVTQYDLELFNRIEHALGMQIEEEPIEKDEVMVLVDRIGEAQRVAVQEMKLIHEGRGKKGFKGRKGKRSRDEMDKEEG